MRVRIRVMAGMGVPAAACLLVAAAALPPAPAGWLDAYQAPVTRIIAEATSQATADFAWNRLAQLTDQFPARLSGSDNLARAIPWVAAQMKRDGLESVHTERVMVPHWVRGAEDAAIVQPYPQPLAIAALGGSVGTGPEGVTAPVLVVKNYDDLEAHAADAKGKIVLYNVPFRLDIDPLVSYREGTQYRGAGASRAAAHGAVAALVRSVGPIGHRTPHTGSMRYAADQPQIPVAAISSEDAEKLQRMHDRGDTVTVRLRLGAQTLPDAESANVIAELRGREKPNEVVLIGGHLDSWDLASGAMDDGGGCLATWEAVRVLQRLKLIPRRTIRLVLFTNEENGTRGGQGYRDAHKDELAHHVLVLESDNGVLPLKGFGFNGTAGARAVVEQIAGLLAPLGANHISDHFDGADIIPSQRAANIPAISPEVDMRRYFFLHHTPADTVDKIDRQDMARVIAAIAAMTYVVADMPEPLERATTGTGQ
jgi:carboxypeptidase Q